MLNGIALGQDHVLITGKRWDRMYKISLGDWPSLYTNNSAGLEGEHQGTAEVEESDENLKDIIAEQEQNEDLVENAVDEELIGDNQNLDYMLGATGMISNEWSVIEQVDHDRTSFT